MSESRKSATTTILLVDDNDSLRTGLSELLTRRGYRVFEAPDPEHALSLVKQLGNELDVLVTDIVMRGMNGFELSRRVQSIYPKIGIIRMSAFGIAETAGSEFDSNVVLSKPIPISVLVEAVERVVRRDPGNSGGG
jgi:DNA-binding NtrC family response regulator